MMDYKEILDDLRRKRGEIMKKYREELGKLDTAISSLESIYGEEPALQQQMQLATPESPFSNMTIADAAYAYLRNAGSPMRARQLADELVASGFETKAKHFPTTLRNSLSRDPRFAVDLGEWGLVEWTPEIGQD